MEKRRCGRARPTIFASTSITPGRCCPTPERLKPLRIAVDCANGAMTAVAPTLFRELGFDLTVLAAEPDGRNINKGVGSTHPEMLAETVRRGGHRLGVAFDGDGDRAIFVDATAAACSTAITSCSCAPSR